MSPLHIYLCPLFKHEIEIYVKDGLKPGLSGFKSCVFLIEMGTCSGMELHGVRLKSEVPGRMADSGGGRHDVGARERNE